MVCYSSSYDTRLQKRVRLQSGDMSTVVEIPRGHITIFFLVDPSNPIVSIGLMCSTIVPVFGSSATLSMYSTVLVQYLYQQCNLKGEVYSSNNFLAAAGLVVGETYRYSTKIAKIFTYSLNLAQLLRYLYCTVLYPISARRAIPTRARPPISFSVEGQSRRKILTVLHNIHASAIIHRPQPWVT